MFLNMDEHDHSALAAIDDKGGFLTYGEAVEFSCQIKDKLPERALIFCLCSNTVGALAGYLGFYQNKDVSLLLDYAINKELLDQLFEIYTPAYIWLPEGLEYGESETVLQFKGFKLIRLSESSPPMHNDLSFLLTTSGSTGNPKLVRHKYGNLEHNAKVVAQTFAWTTQERGICQLPMHYTMGLNVINSLLYSGSTVLLCESNLMSASFWRFIKENKGTNFTGVPYSYDILMKMKFMKMDLPYLKTLSSGGGRLTDENFIKFSEYAANTGRRFFSTFGTTETSARLAFLPPQLACVKTGSIGREFPEGELYLVDDLDNRITETEASGELVYRGENVTMGYARTKDDLMLGDEWNGVFRTGDISQRDSDGYYYIVGRKSRFLKLFGHRIGLDFCEKLIREQFDTECVCTGTDKQMLIFVTNEKAVENTAVFIAEKTLLPKVTFKVSYISEIPRKASGKIDYQLLTEG